MNSQEAEECDQVCQKCGKRPDVVMGPYNMSFYLIVRVYM